jgi:hypothetical protein
MSRERALRREARLAESARRSAEAAQRVARETARRQRRDRRRARVRAVLPWRPGQRWSRRTRAQRATVVVVLLGIGVLTFLLVPSWNLRIAIGLAVLLATPALVTLVLDRSTR